MYSLLRKIFNKTMDKRVFKYARKLHKWFGYILALQIFAWLLGGLVMSAIPLEMVHGKHLANRGVSNPFVAVDYSADINRLTSEFSQLEKIEFTHRLSVPVLKLSGDKEERFYHGKSGEQLAPLTQHDVLEIAKLHYLGEQSTEATANKLANGPREAGYRENIWRVEFADTVATTLYIHERSGQVLTVRSTIWRIFDFFWMLHIMDYDEREDFNNPLLISFAFFSVLFCITGILLLFQNKPWQRSKRKRVGV